MDKIYKQDNRVMQILKVSTINRYICSTDKGVLTLQIRKGEKNYHLVLDAVPLSADDNKELMDIIFPAKVLEVPQVQKDPIKGDTIVFPASMPTTIQLKPKFNKETPAQKSSQATMKNTRDVLGVIEDLKEGTHIDKIVKKVNKKK